MSGQPTIESADLTGPKVYLRPVALTDVDACFDLIHGRDAITDWLIWDGPESREEIVPWYSTWPARAALGDGCDYNFAIVDRADGLFCGTISLRFAGHEFAGDVGYWLAEEKWGRGLMTEAVALVVWLAFAHTGAVLVHAQCFDGNDGSRIVLERNAFELDPLGESKIEKLGRATRLHFFALALSKWVRLGGPGAPLDFNVKMEGI